MRLCTGSLAPRVAVPSLRQIAAFRARGPVSPGIPEGWTPPYSLPAAGVAQFIGTNNIQDVRPATHSAANWARSVFGSFGTGCYVPAYSAGGAYVAAGTGGHLHPSNSGACLFDFADATWKFRSCTNSGFTENDNTGAANDWASAQTGGADHYEITGANGTPAPPHPYATSIPIATGNNGSFLYVSRSAACDESVNSGGSHALNLETGVWTRWTENIYPISLGFESTTLLDSANNRAFVLTSNFHNYQTLHYLNLGTGAYATLGSYSFPAALEGTYSLDSTNGLIIAHTGTALRVIDLATPNNGWATVTVTGTLPTDDNTHWCYHPTLNKFYRLPTGGGTTLGRLVMTGAASATYDTITLTGDTPPAFGDGGDVVTAPYRALIYVSSIDRLAWMSGNGTAITNDQQVTLINPT